MTTFLRCLGSRPNGERLGLYKPPRALLYPMSREINLNFDNSETGRVADSYALRSGVASPKRFDTDNGRRLGPALGNSLPWCPVFTQSNAFVFLADVCCPPHIREASHVPELYLATPTSMTRQDSLVNRGGRTTGCANFPNLSHY